MQWDAKKMSVQLGRQRVKITGLDVASSICRAAPQQGVDVGYSLCN